MSSFIAHAVTALNLDSLTQAPTPRDKAGIGGSLWLLFISIAPDADYIIGFLNPANHEGLRISHALGSILFLPLLTILILQLPFFHTWDRRRYGLQALLIGISHLLLDLLVGVRPQPLLWPLSPATFQLPFGILPSAALLSLTNYYFYRNLFIEMGVLLPLFAGIHLLIRKSPYRRLIPILWITSITFMAWAFTLSR